MIPAPASTRIGYSGGLESRTLRMTGRSASAPATPIARPTAISIANSSTTTPNPASSSVASSIIPIMSAIPTGSFVPASPSRIVPERPRISRPPRTENVTAGSVGAIAAPIRPATIQSMPRT